MTADNDIHFPALQEAVVGNSLVRTVNARDLHFFLQAGKDFSNWIKDRIRLYNFLENQDYAVFAEIGENLSGGRPAKEYAVTLSMAKELSMVERNERGKQARRYFIECERKLKEAAPSVSPDLADLIRRTDGISRMLSHKITVIEQALTAFAPDHIRSLVHAEIAAQGYAVRRGKTAGQIWYAAGYPRMRMTSWFGNKLAKFDCQIEGGGRGELGMLRARLFDPDKAERWLKEGGGDLLVRQKIAERQGQGVLRLVTKP